ncbi:MAG: hypothetical protein EZS28_043023 [Streblomastix strix]|uniref:Uncharacterized protein n=1 Tax=Streblomastix strix TaxID=222440 RepID=A0A5J4TTV8_9EUKA|nr:MAG: hypothetical protein EZS28_043023 [Streblomastix strix]
MPNQPAVQEISDKKQQIKILLQKNNFDDKRLGRNLFIKKYDSTIFLLEISRQDLMKRNECNENNQMVEVKKLNRKCWIALDKTQKSIQYLKLDVDNLESLQVDVRRQQSKHAGLQPWKLDKCNQHLMERRFDQMIKNNILELMDESLPRQDLLIDCVEAHIENIQNKSRNRFIGTFIVIFITFTAIALLII